LTSYQGLYDRNPQVQRWFPQGIEQFAQFVMQRAAQIPDGEEIPDGLPEDMAADIMANMNDGGGGADGFMPGGNVAIVDFGGDEEVPNLDPLDWELSSEEEREDEDEDEDEEEDEDDIAVCSYPYLRGVFAQFPFQPMPIRLVRNLVNRILGRNNAADLDGDSSVDDENDDGRVNDHTGVD
jgi:hypothetical protein